MIQQEQYKSPNLPKDLAELLSEYTCTRNKIGCSSAGVYNYQKADDSLYLKIENINPEIRRQYQITKWLIGKLPVPMIKHYCEIDGFSYFLTHEVKGHMACDCPADELCKPYEKTVEFLAEGLLLLQSVDISDCPFSNILDIKLQNALFNIENNHVDMDDFEEGNDFDSPMDLYNYLIENKPPEEPCFTHGDYCLPNVFIDNKSVTGFIDLGRAGIADKWQDIALCVRSLGYNLRNTDNKEKYINLLFSHLKVEPNWEKINYYILLDELF